MAALFKLVKERDSLPIHYFDKGGKLVLIMHFSVSESQETCRTNKINVR